MCYRFYMSQQTLMRTPAFHVGAYLYHPKTKTIGVVTVADEISPHGVHRTRLRLRQQIEVYFQSVQLRPATAAQIAEFDRRK